MADPKKKIIILGPAHPFRGGIALNNDRIAVQLQREGHEVEIFTFTTQYPGFLFPGKTQFSEDPAPAGIKITRKVSSVNPFNWLKVGNEIKRLKPDILLLRYWMPFMGPCFGTIARRVKKNRHTRIVTVFDNVIPHEKRFGDRLFTKYFLKPVDAFITMSASVEKDLLQFDTVKPRAYNPHPLFDNFGPIIPQQEAKKKLQFDVQDNYLLFFGLIRDYKGLDLLLDAFALLDRQALKLKLMVVGEHYSDKEKYLEQIKRLGIENDVILVDRFIKDAEVAPYFCASDLVAQPYKHATQSGVTQIAYHFEVPMLVTNVGGLPEMVPHGKVGYVVEKDPDAIAGAIRDFYSGACAEQFKSNILVEKEKYSWDKLTAKILSI